VTGGHLLRIHFSPIDWAILGLYVAFLLVVGFWKRKQTAEEYIIADRGLGLWIFTATLVATWYGGILGVGEFIYESGLFEWTTNGLPYYVFAIVFAFVLARKVRGGAVNLYTIPDKLAQAYDKKTALLGASLAFIYASPSGAVLMLGVILQALLGVPIFCAMVLGVIFSVIYVYRGGFLSDVRVNALQFLLMFGGFIAASVLCLHRYGGLHYLMVPGRLPKGHLTLLGEGGDIWLAAAWFFIAMNTLIDPGFHQRCYAAKTPKVAFWGIMLAVLCWMLFDACSLVTGLFSKALIPNLSDALLAYPALADKVMPAGLKGLFTVSLLAPVMASAVSYTFISAMTVGRDFIWRLRGESGTKNVPLYTQVGLVFTSITAIGFALLIPSMVKQWYIFGSVTVPGVLVPLLGAYQPSIRWRATGDWAFTSMIGGVLTSLVWMLWGFAHGGLDNPAYPYNCQPLFPGLAVSIVTYGFGILASRIIEKKLPDTAPSS